MEEEKTKNSLENINDETSLRTIRTYKDDIAQAMNRKKESLVSIAAAENKRRTRSGEFEPVGEVLHGQNLKKVGIVILSTALFVLGAGSALYFYGKSGAGIVEPASKIPSVIFSDGEEELEITNLSRRQILNELTAIKDRTRLSAGDIKNIFITETFTDKEEVDRKALVSSSDFLNAIDAQLPASFMRSLEPIFMLGIHMSVSDGNQPFLILKTSFYENAFTGMLGWEKNIKEDLAPLFGPENFNVISNENYATSTLPVSDPVFSDTVIKNKDARILKDGNGKAVLIYSFVDKDTIVMATNENTFGEILARIR